MRWLSFVKTLLVVCAFFLLVVILGTIGGIEEGIDNSYSLCILVAAIAGMCIDFNCIAHVEKIEEKIEREERKKKEALKELKRERARMAGLSEEEIKYAEENEPYIQQAYLELLNRMK